MKRVQPPESQQLLLDRFAQVGGVVDFVILDCEDEAPDQRLHHQAVVLGLKEIQRRWDVYFERVSSEKAVPRNHFFQVTIDERSAAHLLPRRTTWFEFLGRPYDVESRRLDIPSNGFSHNPEDLGFAYAFAMPPYSLWCSDEERNQLLNEVLRSVLCASEDSLIYRWPTDWSNYFDAGEEWWGSFLWSISNPGDHRIMVLAASTTD